jgi:hypothetical protein
MVAPWKVLALLGGFIAIGEPIATVIPRMGALGVLRPVDWIAVSFVGLSENPGTMLEVPTRARPHTGLHSQAVGTWLNNRPARSTPTTAPLSSRVKKPLLSPGNRPKFFDNASQPCYRTCC